MARLAPMEANRELRIFSLISSFKWPILDQQAKLQAAGER